MIAAPDIAGILLLLVFVFWFAVLGVCVQGDQA